VRNKIPVAAVVLTAVMLSCGPGRSQTSPTPSPYIVEPGKKSGSKGYTTEYKYLLPDTDQNRLATTGGHAAPPKDETPSGPVDPDNSGGPQNQVNPADSARPH
jgi:hypothetical protein